MTTAVPANPFAAAQPAAPATVTTADATALLGQTLGATPVAEVTAPAGGDPFDTATGTFVKPKDLAGCTLVVIGQRVIEGIQSTLSPGKTYDAVEGDIVIVAADRPLVDAVTKAAVMVGGCPVLRSTRLAGGGLVPQLAGPTRNGRPVIGKMTAYPSKFDKDGYKLDGDAVTPEARQRARAWWDANHPSGI